MKKLPLFLILALILLLPSKAYPVVKEISVLLDENASSVSLSGTNMKLTDRNGKELILSGAYTIKKNEDKLHIGKNVFRAPLKAVSDTPMKYNGRAYCGSFIFKNSPGGVRVSNKVDLEEYLHGVIKAEMSTKWDIEALKAQAVLARTFAVCAGAKHGENDLCDGYHCQVYKGISGGDSPADRAVEETAGLILRWNGNPARVYYHSDSGGMVTSSGNVWGGEIAYLKPRPEPFAYSGPNTLWEASVSIKSIQSMLNRSGINIGTINSITPTKRDESGRILELEIKGSGGTKVISGYTFRNLIGAEKIKSTLFEFGARSAYINEQRSYVPVSEKELRPPSEAKYEKIDLTEMPEDKEEKIIWLTEKKIFTTLELMEMLAKPDGYDLYIEKGIARAEGRLPKPEQYAPEGTTKNTAEDKTNETVCRPNLSMASASGPNIRIFGRGSGHGVGMSQWGAKTMAEKGWTYTQILQYYFPGTTIGQ